MSGGDILLGCHLSETITYNVYIPSNQLRDKEKDRTSVDQYQVYII